MRHLVVVALFVAACAHTELRAPLTCTERGGPAWTEVVTTHFRVVTDQSSDTALRTAGTLEEIHAAFEKLWGVGMVRRDTPSTDRVDMIAFERREDFQEIARMERAKAIFAERGRGVQPRPTIVSWGGFGEQTRQILQHELAHRFVRNTIPFCPLWLNEGLAEYYSTFELLDGVARFGKRPAWSFSQYEIRSGMPVERLPTLEKLLAVDWATFHAQPNESSYYAGSWALVHYLEHTPDLRPRFRDYQRRLANGEEPRPAFDAAFEGVDRARIDREFREQAGAPGVAVLEGRFSAAAVEKPTAWTRLDDAQVHLLFAWLRPRIKANQAKIRFDLDEATRLKPESAEAADLRSWFEEQSGHLAEAEQAARQAVALAPSDPRYQFDLALVVYLRTAIAPKPHDWKPLRALLKPLWPAAKTAYALNFLGWSYAEMGEPDLALPFARKAVDLDSACFQCLDTLARVLADTGFIEEALPLEERAVALLPERLQIPAMLRKLEQYRAAVHTRPPPSP